MELNEVHVISFVAAVSFVSVTAYPCHSIALPLSAASEGTMMPPFEYVITDPQSEECVGGEDWEPLTELEALLALDRESAVRPPAPPPLAVLVPVEAVLT